MPTDGQNSPQGDGQVDADGIDYYELLQISPNADQDTVTRVFRLLARRYHPDHPDTGNEEKFREILGAYAVLSDPEKRAHYDVNHLAIRRERWRFVAEGAPTAGDYAAENQVRLVVLEILYARRRTEPHKPGLSLLDLSELMGQPLEHLEFSSWYLVQKKFVMRNDQSQLQITADGVDHLEEQRRHESPRLRLAETTGLRSAL
jgi:curved DNA-binding protein CbpA